ncbi:hypothetical protein SK128_012387 [Halocaridina rubra]|uniref:Uncharacterized protein n=1 Tax=Halocaridina rubra TaxID=373956 RepID=A0AAN8WMY4_HALRR
MAAVAFATPVICLPVTPDQRLASSQLKSLGVAEVIASADVTVSRIRETVAKMTSDRGYRERCRKLGEEFHDQPLSAADRLLFSLERVIRKPYSRRYENRIINNLYLLQQSNADVYLLLLILLTSIIGFLIALSIMVLPILMKKHKAKAE